jgi:hypothetical protein
MERKDRQKLITHLTMEFKRNYYTTTIAYIYTLNVVLQYDSSTAIVY